MPVSNPYAAVIADLEAELEGIETKIRELTSDANGLRTTLGMLRPRAGTVRPQEPAAAPKSLVDIGGSGDGGVGEVDSLEGLKIIEAVEWALRTFGRPMQTPDIAEFLLERGFPYDRDVKRLRDSIGVVTNRDIKEHEETTPFRKLGAGRYGLREWGERFDEEQELTLSGGRN